MYSAARAAHPGAAQVLKENPDLLQQLPPLARTTSGGRVSLELDDLGAKDEEDWKFPPHENLDALPAIPTPLPEDPLLLRAMASTYVDGARFAYERGRNMKATLKRQMLNGIEHSEGDDALFAARIALQSWAEAYSKQDVDAYLASYDESFEPDDGTSLEAWRRQRRERLTEPDFIEVDLVTTAAYPYFDRAVRIEVEQRYRSDVFEGLTRKRFILVKVDDDWRIVREVSLP